MNAKQARFVAEYLIDLNATQAAVRAGYGAKNANVVGPRLLANVGIAKAIQIGKTEQLRENALSANRVLEEMRRLSFSNVQDLFDEDSNLISLKKLPREIAATIASLEIIKKNAEAGDGHTDKVHKLRVWDKVRSLETLAKHFGLLVDRIEHQGNVEFTWKK